MRLALVVLLCAAGCAHWRAGDQVVAEGTGVSCTHEVVGPPRWVETGVKIECRKNGDPRTARAIIVGEKGATLEAAFNIKTSTR